MALSSTLSPPFTTTTHSSSTAASFPTPLRLTATLPFQSSNNKQCLCLSVNPISPNPKWRTQVSFFTGLLTNNNKTKTAEAIKEELLEAIKPLDRGAEATPEDQQEIERIVRKLEAVNPTKEPLKSGLLDGKWELLYTTSASILQTKRPKLLRSKGNYQGINVDTLRAQNMESFPFFNQVTADLTPVNSKKVAVQFDYFKIGGLIPVKAPETAQGSLEFTYLDEELRVSRGDKGNLFVLKMIDPSYRVPTK